MLERAAAAGVTRVLTVGSDLATSRRALQLAERHPGLYAAPGVHPYHVAAPLPLAAEDISLSPDSGGEGRREGAEPAISPHPNHLPQAGDGIDSRAAAVSLEKIGASLRELARSSGRVVALGEMGLDYRDSTASPVVQRAVLDVQLRLARELDLPVVLHEVDAEADLLAALRETGVARGVVHYFVGDAASARRCLDAGLHLAVGRPLLKPGFDALRQAVREVPRDRLLVETDTLPWPDRTTEPRDVLDVAAQVGALWGISVEEAACITRENALRLFDLSEAQGLLA